MRQLLLFPRHPPADLEPPPLTPDEQRDVIAGLLKGGSPLSVCRASGLDVAAFQRAVDDDAGFRRRLRQTRELLTLNVVSTVYAAALKGTPAAQALWLRTFAPPAWPDPTDLSSLPADSFPAEPHDDLASLPTDAIDLQLAAYRSAGFEPDEPAA